MPPGLQQIKPHKNKTLRLAERLQSPESKEGQEPDLRVYIMDVWTVLSG